MKRLLTLSFLAMLLFCGSVLYSEDLTIGTQIWMAKNLDVDHYRNGDVIPQVTDATEWANLTTGAWCYYENDANNGTTYGKLYNWYAVNDSRGLAPEGWHIPSTAEGTTLSDYLGGGDVAGGKLKEAGYTHWDSPNTDASNKSGFTALPCGYRNTDGIFYNIKKTSYLWSSTEYSSTMALYGILYYNDAGLYYNHNSKTSGFSVRCVKERKITLTSPSNNATEQARNLTFKWVAITGASEYQIQASPNQNFSNTIIDSKTTATSCKATSLSNSKSYYWRVRCKVGSDYTSWSDTWKFTTVSGDIDLESGLVAYYPFEENADDKSGNTRNGTEYGTSLSYPDGVKGKCVKFDNYPYDDWYYVNDYIQLPDISINSTFSISFWIRIDGTYDNNDTWIVPFSIGDDKFGDSPRDYLMIAYILNITDFDCYLQNVHNWAGANITTVENSKWKHFAVVIDSNSITTYLNGQLAHSEDKKFDLQFSNQPNYLGFSQWENGSMYASRFNGAMDELYLYNRALSDAEVGALYGPTTKTIPQIKIAKALVKAGETQTITGSGYPYKDTVRLHIFTARAEIDTFDIYTSGTGEFTYEYKTDSTFYAGRYLVSTWLKSNTGVSSNQLQFELQKDEPEAEMWIIQPQAGDTITLGIPFQLTWYDKMVLYGQDSINGTNRFFKYQIEYKKPNSETWIQLDTLQGLASLYQQIMFNTMVTISDTSDCESIRVIDLTALKEDAPPIVNNTSGLGKSGMKLQGEKSVYRKVPVSNLYSSAIDKTKTYVTVTREWDTDNLKYWTGNEPSKITNKMKNPLGVVADGNSRIIFKVTVHNIDPAKPIKMVEISLPNAKTADYTGKLEYYKVDYGNLGYYPVISDPKFNDDTPKKADCSMKPEEYQTATTGTFYFWYQAPLNIDASNNYYKVNGENKEILNIKVDFKDVQKSLNKSENISVKLPPLFLVAGVGGNMDGQYWKYFAFENPKGKQILFTSSDNISIPYVGQPAMKSYNGYDARLKELLDDNHQDGINSVVKNVLLKGLACTQVDWVGHSMGGATGRAFIEYFNDQKLNCSSKNIHVNRTYGNGYIHKFITISSPHIGAPGANILVDWVNYINNSKNPKDIQELIDLAINIKMWMKKSNFGLVIKDDNDMQNVINYFTNVKNNWETGKKDALLTLQKVYIDLQLPQNRNSSTDILGNNFRNLKDVNRITEKGRAFQNITVPNYLIGSNLSSGLGFLSGIKYYYVGTNPNDILDFKRSCFTDIKYVPELINNLFINVNLGFILGEVSKINSLFSIYGYTQNEKEHYFNNESDAIIGKRSQLNGRTQHCTNYYNSIPEKVKKLNVFELYTYNHGNTIKRERIEIGNHVMDLLKKPIDLKETYFANTLSLPTQSEINPSLVYPKSQIPNSHYKEESETEFTTKLNVTSPTDSSMVKTNDYLDVSFELSDTTGLKNCSVEFQNNYYNLDSIRKNNTINIPITHNILGKQYVNIKANYLISEVSHTLDTMVYVVIETDENLQKFKVSPNSVNLRVTDVFKPTMTAYYETGITDVSNSMNNKISVTYSKDSIIAYDSTYKSFSALKLGSTIAIIKYLTLRDTIYFDVISEYVKPDSIVTLVLPENNIVTKQDTMLFKWKTVNNAHYYKLEIATDVSFENVLFSKTEIIDTTYTMDTLYYGLTYYWRVKAVGEGGSSNWSDTWNFANGFTHTLPLAKGWNMISTYIVPENDSISVVLKPIADSLVIAKNQAGLMYLPSKSIDLIKKWNVRQGYMVYMKDTDTLDIKGVPLPKDSLLYLAKGWNIIAYTRKTEQAITTALAGLDSNFIIVKNGAGLMYLPSKNVNLIGNMKPGAGYLIYMKSDDTLDYPDGSGKRTVDEFCKLPSHLIAKTSPYNMNLIVEADLPDDWEIGAYNADGVLVGSGLVENGKAAVTIFADDENTVEIDGARAEESVTFKAYNPKNDLYETFDFAEIQDIVSEKMLPAVNYTTNTVLSAKAATEIKAGEDYYVNIYPNPTKNKIELQINFSEATTADVKVYDLQGNELMNVFAGNLPKGETKLQINCEMLPNGTYNVVIQMNDKSIMKRFVVQR